MSKLIIVLLAALLVWIAFGAIVAAVHLAVKLFLLALFVIGCVILFKLAYSEYKKLTDPTADN